MREIITLQCGDCKNHNDKKQKETLRTAGNKEVLQYVPQADCAQGSEVASSRLRRAGPELFLGESSNGYDSGPQSRVWGFESLLPWQSFTEARRKFSRELEREVMATRAAKMSKEETPSGKGSELTQKITGTVQNTRDFIQETRVEMKKVTWPSREEVISTTGVVLATVAFFAIYLYFIEQGAARAVGYLLKRFGA